MIPEGRERALCIKKLRDFFEISRLINLNFDVDVVVAKSISFVADRLKKRVRLYLLDDRGDLVIKHWAGDHSGELHKGIVVVKKSIVWDAFEKGIPVNITDEAEASEFDHTLKTRIKIKAVIPIRYQEADSSLERRVGVMVIDSGSVRTTISEEDFVYLVEMADLIAQAIARALFFGEYRRMRDRLTLVQEERIRVLNILVHELRNPLTIIGGFTKKFPEIIERINNTINLDERDKYLDKLLHYSKIVAKEEYRIEESINDFVKFLRVTEPHSEILLSVFSLKSLIEDVLAKFKELSRIKHLKICYSKKDIKIRGDREGIFTVLDNLIYNGINFSPENGRLTIFTNVEGDDVYFSVRTDTFIPRRYRKEIFDFYFKVLSSEDTGTGLGLPIAKQIVERNKGTIVVISKKIGRKRPLTRFIVKIPKGFEEERSAG
jgi:signal transduction histidine kinase